MNEPLNIGVIGLGAIGRGLAASNQTTTMTTGVGRDDNSARIGIKLPARATTGQD